MWLGNKIPTKYKDKGRTFKEAESWLQFNSEIAVFQQNYKAVAFKKSKTLFLWKWIFLSLKLARTFPCTKVHIFWKIISCFWKVITSVRSFVRLFVCLLVLFFVGWISHPLRKVLHLLLYSKRFDFKQILLFGKLLWTKVGSFLQMITYFLFRGREFLYVSFVFELQVKLQVQANLICSIIHNF
jgi:hypothetical protein